MTPLRILVVDDEPGMLRAIARVLGSIHRVTTSASSLDAIALARELQPDLAILDIRMPDPDGFALMARLVEQHPDLDVILMTGSVDDQDEKLVRAIRGAAFYFIQKPFDRDVLRTLVDRCAELRHRRQESRRHVARLEREIAEARAFQQALLPEREVVRPGLAVWCRQTPSSEIGGDLYDHAVDASGRTALLIADVAGHGASAAMLTAVVKSAFRASERDDYEPGAVVDRVRVSIETFGWERFVTLIAALVSPATGEVTYVNAGHPPGVVWNVHGRRTRLTGTGPLVSPVLRDVRWEQTTVSIATGDRLLLYTDGVSDALFRERDAEAPIRELIDRHAEGGVPLLDAILVEVARRGGDVPQDDLTLITGTVGEGLGAGD
jgi:sigma-B regulation protein RsbU (phosphoserine phosphatase)